MVTSNSHIVVAVETGFTDNVQFARTHVQSHLQQGDGGLAACQDIHDYRVRFFQMFQFPVHLMFKVRTFHRSTPCPFGGCIGDICLRDVLGTSRRLPFASLCSCPCQWFQPGKFWYIQLRSLRLCLHPDGVRSPRTELVGR